MPLLDKEKNNNHNSKDLPFRKDAVLGTTEDPVKQKVWGTDPSLHINMQLPLTVF